MLSELFKNKLNKRYSGPVPLTWFNFNLKMKEGCMYHMVPKVFSAKVKWSYELDSFL